MVLCTRAAVARRAVGAHALRGDVVARCWPLDLVAAVGEPAVAVELQLVARHVVDDLRRAWPWRRCLADCRRAAARTRPARPSARHRGDALVGELHRGRVGAAAALCGMNTARGRSSTQRLLPKSSPVASARSALSRLMPRVVSTISMSYSTRWLGSALERARRRSTAAPRGRAGRRAGCPDAAARRVGGAATAAAAAAVRRRPGDGRQRHSAGEAPAPRPHLRAARPAAINEPGHHARLDASISGRS